MVKTYMARFPVADAASPERITDIVRRWVVGSPHKNFTLLDLNMLDQDGFTSSIDGVTVSTLAGIVEGHTVCGHRLEDDKKGRIWRTDIVYAHEPHQVSVAQHFESRVGGRRFETRESPRIVSDILQGIGGGKDIIPVCAEAYFPKEYDVEMVVRLMEAPQLLPVVYLSRTVNSLLATPPGQAAYHLAGMAHVVVEPSKTFSHILRRESGRNAYRGAVGVYWPSGMYRRLPASDNVLSEIFAYIREGQINSVSPRWLSIDGIRSAKSSHNVESLRKVVSEQGLKLETKDEAFLNSIISEIDEKDRVIQDLEESISQIHKEIARKSKETPTQLTLVGTELYPGEINDMIIDAIEHYLKSIPSDSRRMYVLRRALEKRAKTGEHDEIVDELSRILNERQFHRQRAALQQLGFEIDESGKHASVSVPGCPISVSMSKTASDYRSGKNALSIMKRKLL